MHIHVCILHLLSLFVGPQVLLYEPHREVPNEFVYIPSYIAFHDQSSVSEAVSGVHGHHYMYLCTSNTVP